MYTLNDIYTLTQLQIMLEDSKKNGYLHV